MRRRRRLFVASAALAGAVLITSCGEDPPATVDSFAQSLARALSSGDFSQVSFASGSAETLSQAAENLHEPFGELTPEVTVAQIDVLEPPEDSPRAPTAEITYEHRWDLGELGISGEEWAYTTTAEFSYDAEADVWHAEATAETLLPGYAGHEGIGLVTTSAERGRIMDDNGRALVYNRDVVTLGLDKTQLSEAEDSEDAYRAAAAQLAAAVGINEESYTEKVMAYGEQAFVDAITIRRDSTDISVADIEGIPGAVAVPGTRSLAPTRDFAPLLLGRVDPVTAEHIENDPTLQVGDMVGTSGIQASREDQLRGVPGMRIHKDGETLWSVEPQTGQDIPTTMNPRLQELAQQITGEQDVTSALVAIRPSDGGILAAASHSPEENFVETATQSSFAPGSTFKMVSALAMLRDGLSPDSQVACPARTTVHGQVFSNVPGYPGEYIGTHRFRDLLAVSCNTLFAAAYDDVTSADLHQAAVDLGLLQEPRIGVPAIMGSVPDDSDLNLHAANLFGQGVVESSALGMATVAASIAAGETVHPHLVIPQEPREPEGQLGAEEAQQLMTLMTDTVNFGTLSSMDPVPGEHVYAKTGTAEAGEGDETYAHTWVIAIQGDLAVAIFLEEGEFGGSTNGPLLHQFLTGARDILN